MRKKRKHVISDNRRMLMGYLREIGCRKSAAFQIAMIDLESELAIIDMLEFCRKNHPNLTEEQLLEESAKIASAYEPDNSETLGSEEFRNVIKSLFEAEEKRAALSKEDTNKK